MPPLVRGSSRSTLLPLLSKGLQSILRDKRSRRLLWYVAVESVLVFVTAAVSVATDSLALWMLMFLGIFDVGGLCIYLCSMYCSTLRPTADFSFGYERVEVLLLFAMCILLILASVFGVKESMERLLEPPEIHDTSAAAALLVLQQQQQERGTEGGDAASVTTLPLSPSSPSLPLTSSATPVLAIVSLVMHLVGVYLMNKYTTISRGMMRSQPRPIPILSVCFGDTITEKNAPAMVGAACCLLVLAGSFVVGLDPSAVFSVDALVATALAILIALMVYPIAACNALILLQTAPAELATSLDKCLREVSTCDGVLEYGNEHFWAVAHGKLAGSLHVRVRRDASEAAVLAQIASKLAPFVSAENLTVQIVKDDYNAAMSPARVGKGML